jgi:D-beta-D-heptose 7-phosphate kinase/D-beta-D-heptose 1-phosphate adenosyltransferase
VRPFNDDNLDNQKAKCTAHEGPPTKVARKERTNNVAIRDKILVVGDLMLDRRIEGEMTRISPEAPSPIIRSRAVSSTPGGAGNLAANLAALYDPVHSRGASKVRVSGILAKDQAGSELFDLLTSSGCAIEPAYCSLGNTTVKMRVTCGGQQILRIDSQDDWVSNEAGMKQHLTDTLHTGTDIGAVVAADYGKGALTPGVVEWITGACETIGIPLYVDAKPRRNIHLYQHASLFKCNLREAIELADKDGIVHAALAGEPVDQATCAARILRQRYSFGVVVVTLGDGGCLFHDAASCGHVKTTPATVYDVTGAGDTFMAALATAVSRGYGLEESCNRANIAAGIAVSHHGTYTVGDDEWQDAIEASRGWEAKVVTLKGATDRAARKRRQGKKIVLANGCFDLLHYGHLHLLAEAKAFGDVLFVACNTDDSVRALKGPQRPVIGQTHRLEALARFADVDYVLPFEGDVDTVVRALQADVLVKGAEYEGTKVPGTDCVASHGGAVRFASMAPGYSTSEIIRRPP